MTSAIILEIFLMLFFAYYEQSSSDGLIWFRGQYGFYSAVLDELARIGMTLLVPHIPQTVLKAA